MTLVPVKFWIRVAILGGLLAGPFGRTAVAATVTVPGNYPTIQAAINAVVGGSVADGSTINVQAGSYPESLFVGSTSRSFTVRAVGGAVIVDAAGKGAAAITITDATGQIVFQGLTFRNGTRNAGGGFFVQNSSPSFVNCIFENNTAYDGAGGALFSSNASFTGCTIRNNSAAHFGGGVFIVNGSHPVFTSTDILTNASGTGGNGAGGNNGAGGGVFSNDASPTFRWSHINANTSKFASGGIHHQGVFGSPYGRSMLLVEDTEIADNISSQFPGEPNPSEGGGMHVEDNATATLTRVRVLRNRAGTGGGLNAYRGRIDVVDSTIDANQATAGFGGGIATTSNFATAQMPPSIVNLTGTLVRNNTAPMGGGITAVGDNYSSLRASLSLNGSVVDNNTSTSQGGGILINHGDVSIANSLIIRNTVSGSATPFGGGLLVTTSASATIAGSTFARNTAAGSNGLGGGLFVNDGTVFNMNTSRVYDNTAGNRGGGIFLGNAAQSGNVQTSIIADNSSLTWAGQINEDVCTSVTYTSNTITPLSGSVQFSGCAPGGRASGNNSNVPRFASFLAAPSAGTSMTLAWSVARATSVTIAGVGTWNSPNNSPTGTVDVTPSSSTTYSLTATATSPNGGNYGPVNVGVTVVLPPTTPGGSFTDGDFNGDGKADVTVFRPSNGTWYIRQSNDGQTFGLVWGGGTDVPVQGDYDGDGKADMAVFRPSNGTWYLRHSSDGSLETIVWGGAGDVVATGDYDGDGKTDAAVFRPSNGTWYIRHSSTGATFGMVWGGQGDVPVPGDYDNDGKSDIAIFRPSNGTWYLRSSVNGALTTSLWGGGADIVTPGDYDADGRTDIAVFRPSDGKWWIRNSSTGLDEGLLWGGVGDVPVPGDYDGDGKTDMAVFRPSIGTWYLRNSTNGSLTTVVWGGSTDIPILKRP